MSSAVAELEAGLQAMLHMKPPGVSGSKISAITALCNSNIESESVLIQKLYTHFKKAPATHKLGVLYVVDSVTRKWTEQAKSAGQAIDRSAADGTYGAGVYRVKDLLSSLMNDIIQSAPSDQKDKIRKLVDIWEKGQTFPLDMLIQYKDKLDETPSKPTQEYQTNFDSSDRGATNVVVSTTPEGSPPRVEAASGNQQSTAPPPDTNAILAVLANMAKQNQNAQNTAPPPKPTNMNTQPSSYNTAVVQPAQPAQAVQQNGTGVIPQMPMPGVNVSAAPNGNYAPQFQGQNSGVQNVPSNQANPFAGPMPVPNFPPLAGAVDPMQTQLALIQLLAAQHVPQEQWAGILMSATAAMAMPGAGFPQLPPPPLPFGQALNQNPAQNGNGWPVNQANSRDRNGNGFNDGVRSPPNQLRRGRSRSRSPQRNGGWNRNGDSNGYGAGRGDDRNGRGAGRGNNGQYRQRSPARRGRTPSPPRLAGSNSAKWTDFDASIPKDNIKVLSRTLFVGGVTISENELRSIFDRFGKVQTCIVNKDKRHAFVKMISRKDAEAAKIAMEKNHSAGSMRTRWGVGFGPRDCSDYQTGISVIPIDKLTDADRKWMLSAEYGGTGGLSIEGGLVVEEPDIEIGQGVSSKAISRRMQTDGGGKNGPKSGRDYDNDGGNRGGFNNDGGNRGGFNNFNNRRNEHRGNDDRNTQTVTAPPAVPGFQFPFHIGPNGFPVFPGASGFPMMPQQQNGNNGNGNGNANGQSQQSGGQSYRG